MRIIRDISKHSSAIYSILSLDLAALISAIPHSQFPPGHQSPAPLVESKECPLCHVDLPPHHYYKTARVKIDIGTYQLERAYEFRYTLV